jgi:hypothetical protein
MFVVVERKNSTKKVGYGHFAECNTRQRHPLPSAIVTALQKPGNQSHFRPVSQLCRVPRPWHAAKNFQKKKFKALPSAKEGALGKEFQKKI